jgi:hypothetical protein
MKDNSESGTQLALSRIFVGAIATILLGAVGSGMWELIFHPDVDWFSKGLSALSQHLDDEVFESAALDPRPIGSLIILFLVVQVPLWIAIFIFAKEFGSSFLERLFDSSNDLSNKDKRSSIEKLYRIKRFFGIVCIILSIGLFLAARTGFSVANQAVLIWRVFHANLARCAPYISTEQKELFIARFHSLQNRQQYEALEAELEMIAAKYKVRLENKVDKST